MRVHNQGVAFGFGNGTAWAPVVFLLVPVIALTLIRIFWKKGVFNHPLSKIAVALLLCGIFGNLTDRLVQGFLLEEFAAATWWQRLSEGYVVDFIAIKLPLYDKLVPSSGGWWPAFNVADSCICVAAVLLFIGGLREENAQRSRARRRKRCAMSAAHDRAAFKNIASAAPNMRGVATKFVMVFMLTLAAVWSFLQPFDPHQPSCVASNAVLSKTKSSIPDPRRMERRFVVAASACNAATATRPTNRSSAPSCGW